MTIHLNITKDEENFENSMGPLTDVALIIVVGGKELVALVGMKLIDIGMANGVCERWEC